jgi:hypothetical protein
MRIHSDTLTRSDLRDALAEANLDGVWLDLCDQGGSRSRAHGFTVRLAANPMPGRRRPRNSGKYGAEDGTYEVAATWAEHGMWMARIFQRDPNAIVAHYKGEDHFHALTKYAFCVEVSA